MKVGKVTSKYKVGEHFKLTIDDGLSEWERDELRVRAHIFLASASPRVRSAGLVVSNVQPSFGVSPGFPSTSAALVSGTSV